MGHVLKKMQYLFFISFDFEQSNLTFVIQLFHL